MPFSLPLAQVSGLFAQWSLAAAGAAAVGIPIAIHLLTRFRRRREPWAAMRFLIEAFRRQRQRIRLEQLLLLLVRCLVLLLLQPPFGEGGFHTESVCSHWRPLRSSSLP